ncbi:circularly permuted type 2 ATP-grasp protein [Corallincola spongiicola]|uniref:Circularly permuted type 2 ATP-grasp protein n=1 Tax=Corallincola spongiicola TaxID=2520508 RepID=A0ABY1WLW2_9GAMM|nr:circularly permuted type 2 ATP-grasp protein [Corallincola spongiicola]TAA42593.1 circularly permuted type 2 ATP-grasp protein [Corallincola spongiicola]
MRLIKQEHLQAEFFDELVNTQGEPRKEFSQVTDFLGGMTPVELGERQQDVQLCIREMGISFTVYSEGENIDREWPFDLIPRLISLKEWLRTKDGLVQRLTALNCFIDDVYNEQKIVRDNVVPAYVIEQSKGYRPECQGFSPAYGAWANICGSDLVRDDTGAFYVLEDNLRVPSGVSYMLENRKVMKRIFPEVFQNQDILPNSDYPNQLRQMLTDMSPRQDVTPTIVVLTPGIYNSAYFEHSYLAQQMGASLVEGQDLVVEDDKLYMKTVDGLCQVDVVYRRIDDEFIDPEVFNPDSMLGVAGLMRVWQQGNVALVNAPGAGVADDKVVYAFVPDMIRYYLNEEPILNNVPTYLCVKDDDRAYVLDHLEELVVKPASESGGYGMLIGPHASAAEIEEFRQVILDNPRNYIAQPTLKLSTVPTLCDAAVEQRHVDLRPFILQGKDSYVTEGGLTRVALTRGSLVVNSSQGGGSKDTWIVDTAE